MNKKAIAIVSLLLVLCFVLTACDGTTNTGYDFDGTSHWLKGQTSDKQPHTFDGGVVVKQATATDDGDKIFTCTVCKYVRHETIPATGETDDHTHDYGTSGVCSCGRVKPHTHTFVGGICNVCKHPESIARIESTIGLSVGNSYRFTLTDLRMTDKLGKQMFGSNANQYNIDKVEGTIGWVDNGNIVGCINLVGTVDVQLDTPDNKKETFTRDVEFFAEITADKAYFKRRNIFSSLAFYGYDYDIVNPNLYQFAYDYDDVSYGTMPVDDFLYIFRHYIEYFLYLNMSSYDYPVNTPIEDVLDFCRNELTSYIVFAERVSDVLSKIKAADGKLAKVVDKIVDLGLVSKTYTLDFNALRTLNKTLNSKTAESFVDDLLGDGFTEGIPQLLKDLGGKKLKEIVAWLQKEGIDILEVRDLVDDIMTFVDRPYARSLDEMIGSIFMISDFSLEKFLKDETAMTKTVAEYVDEYCNDRSSQYDNPYEELSAEICKYVDKYKGISVYTLLAFAENGGEDDGEITASYIKNTLDKVITVAEQLFPVKVGLNHGVVNELEWDGSQEISMERNDNDPYIVKRLVNLVDSYNKLGCKVKLVRNGNVSFDRAAKLKEVQENTDYATAITPTTREEAENLFKLTYSGYDSSVAQDIVEENGQWYIDMSSQDREMQRVLYGSKYTTGSVMLDDKYVFSMRNLSDRVYIKPSGIYFADKCGSKVLLTVILQRVTLSETTYYIGEDKDSAVTLTDEQLDRLYLFYPELRQQEKYIADKYWFSGNIVYDTETKELSAFNTRLNTIHQWENGEFAVSQGSCAWFNHRQSHCTNCQAEYVLYSGGRHNETNTEITLLPDSESCMDGVKYTQTCVDCNKVLSEKVLYEHKTTINFYYVDGACQHRIGITSCLCGYDCRISIDGKNLQQFVEDYMSSQSNMVQTALDNGVRFSCYCGMTVDITYNTDGAKGNNHGDIDTFVKVTYNGDTICSVKLGYSGSDDYYSGWGRHAFGAWELCDADDCTSDSYAYMPCLVDGCTRNNYYRRGWQDHYLYLTSRKIVKSNDCMHKIETWQCACGRELQVKNIRLYYNYEVDGKCDCGFWIDAQWSVENTSCGEISTGVLTFKNGDTVLGTCTVVKKQIEHKYSYEFTPWPEPGYPDDYTFKATCIGCGRSFSGGCEDKCNSDYYDDELFKSWIKLSDYGCCAEHYAYYLRCACGKHNAIVTDVAEGADNKCSKCGLTFVVTSDKTVGDCVLTTVSKYLLSINGQTIASGTDIVVTECHNYKYTYELDYGNCGDGVTANGVCCNCGHETTERMYNHVFEWQFVLNGETCNDGYIAREVCVVCGYEFNVYSSSTCEQYTLVEVSYLCSDGNVHTWKLQSCACGKALDVEYSGVCNENNSSSESKYVWNYDCGINLHISNNSSTDIENCVMTKVDVYSFVIDGHVIASSKKVVVTECHNYKYTYKLDDGATRCGEGLTVTGVCCYCGDEISERRRSCISKWSYTLHGENCHFGCTEQLVCIICGDKDSFSHDWKECVRHNFAEIKYICPDGHIHKWKYERCACGKSTKLNYYGSCVETDVSTETEIVRNYNCGLSFNLSVYSVVDGCVLTTEARYSLSINGQIIANNSEAEVTDYHKYKYEYELNEGAANCSGGVTVTGVCYYCGHKTTRRTYDHVFERRYTLCGETCKDGYTAQDVCIVCGYESGLYSGNTCEEFLIEEILYICQDGNVHSLAFRSCACGAIFYIYPSGACNAETTNTETGTVNSYDCGIILKLSESMADDGKTGVIAIELIKDNKVLYKYLLSVRINS